MITVVNSACFFENEMEKRGVRRIPQVVHYCEIKTNTNRALLDRKEYIIVIFYNSQTDELIFGGLCINKKNSGLPLILRTQDDKRKRDIR